MFLQSALPEITRLGLPLNNASLEVFKQHLDPAWIEQALQQTGTQSLRQRLLPAATVVWLILAMALFGDRSMAAVMSHLHLYDTKALGTPRDKPPTKGAIVQARDRLGEAPLRQLFELTADHWLDAGHTDHLFHGLRTLAMDGTQLRLPDSFENAEVFGVPKSGRSRGAFPQLRLVTVMDPYTHLALRGQIGPCTQGELTVAEPLWKQIPPDSLLLLDMGLGCYRTLAQLNELGERRYWMTRKKKNVHCRVIKHLGPGDDLVVLHRPKGLDRSLPETLTARAIHYQWPGYPPQTLLTNLLSPEHFPAQELIAHYHERWESEQSWDELKTDMLDEPGAQLRSRAPERVRQEAWGLLIMYNLVRLQMLELAQEQGVPVRQLSFRGAMLLCANVWQSAWHTSPGSIYELMTELQRNLQLLLLPRRRTRNNPREVKRKMSNYRKKQRRHHLN
jgi:hypothetical protein